jgi:hypothetical protein
MLGRQLFGTPVPAPEPAVAYKALPSDIGGASTRVAITMLAMVAWPLTGRVEELALITDTLRTDSDYCGVVIAGTAGVGKTRLAAEAAKTCRASGWITHSVVGTPAAQSIPLGAFAQWVEAPTASY